MRETDRQTDRQRQRQTEREKERERERERERKRQSKTERDSERERERERDRARHKETAKEREKAGGDRPLLENFENRVDSKRFEVPADATPSKSAASVPRAFSSGNQDRNRVCKPCSQTATLFATPHPGVELRANLKSISHRYYLRKVASEWELTRETIYLPLGCLQGGEVTRGLRVASSPCLFFENCILGDS